MSFTRDEKTAVYLSVAEPDKAWRLLDRFTPERFDGIFQAKAAILESLSRQDLEVIRSSNVDVVENRDSARHVLPHIPVDVERLAWLPTTARIGWVLAQLRGATRLRVLSCLEDSLQSLLSRRVEQEWQLTPEAAAILSASVRFDKELFDSFGRRAPTSVAEWLLDRLWFGVHRMGRVCELTPVNGISIRSGKRMLRQLADSEDPVLSRTGQIAIVLMSLPPELSAQVFKAIDLQMVHDLTLAISNLPPIAPELRRAVVEQVTEMDMDRLEENFDAPHMVEVLKRWLKG